MSKRGTVLVAVCGILLGVVIGFLIAPIKKGIEIGNNAGNTTNYYGEKRDEEKI